MVLTKWGYYVDADEVPDFVGASAFEAATGGRWASRSDEAAKVAAAQASLRNECGWHVSPPLACVYRAHTAETRTLVQLPASHVSDVSSVEIDGEALGASAYHVESNGLLHLDDPAIGRGWNDIEVSYTAGLPVSQVADLAQVACQRASHALSVPVGVNSETADGVSVSYGTSRSQYDASVVAAYSVGRVV